MRQRAKMIVITTHYIPSSWKTPQEGILAKIFETAHTQISSFPIRNTEQKDVPNEIEPVWPSCKRRGPTPIKENSVASKAGKLVCPRFGIVGSSLLVRFSE